MSSSPFEVPFETLVADLDVYVDSVFASLASDFLTPPKGQGFLPYADFEHGYEVLKHATHSFVSFQPAAVIGAIESCGVALIVLRTMLGFTPPEWAYIASTQSSLEITQGFARSLEGKIRTLPLEPLRLTKTASQRVKAMVDVGCAMLLSGPPAVEPGHLHRLDKADTAHGLDSLRSLAALGVPYPVLLYERFLGRPFAAHRDSVSELIGDAMEGPIEGLLCAAGISYRKTKRAEKVVGFDQTPDFIVPDEFTPSVVIEAKICEDDGTARDKVTRVQHLAEISASRQPNGREFQVVACIGGRGFGIRRGDMKKLLLATRGKVFTLRTLPSIIKHTDLSTFATR